MATFCIVPELAIKLRNAARNGEISKPSEMLEMTSKERRAMFGKFTDEKTASEINTAFEKALTSQQKDALNTWVSKTFNAEVKKSGGAKSALDKIAELNEKGLLTPKEQDSFLEDLVSDKLGVTISAQEAQVISEKAAKIEKLENEFSEIGLPTKEYWKARSELDKYIQAQMPASNLRVMTSTIGRAMMLASFKSPLVNIESNTVQAVLTAFERRIANNSYTGLNGDFALKYMKENFGIFEASGYDTSRMTALTDDKKILGEEITHSQGKGAVRWFSRHVAEDIVFKQLMAAPDVAFSSMHFADSANLASTKIAQGEGLKGKEAKNRALEIFKDSIQLEPKTIEGELVRSQAIADAQYATYTNKSTYSDVALAIRKVLNIASKDARIGDQIMPFVKTPANVVGAGIDYSGIGLPLQMYLLPKAIKQAKAGDSVALKRSIRAITRAGLGLTLAFALSQAFEPEDFIGNYPVSQKEQELLELKNATPNSVRIGDKWVSLDYFGSLAAPFVGMMYARKYGHTKTEDILKYYQGVGVQALKIPGFRDFQDIVKDVTDLTNEKKTGEKELTTATTNVVLDYLRSRVVPAIVNDVAKATDTYEREANIKEDPLARIKAAIPGVRQSLPEKKNVLGNPIKAEGALSTLLFGSRVKTAEDNKLIKELVRLDGEGQLPSITDVEKSSTRVKNFKEQIDSRKFEQAMGYYHQLFKNRVQRTVNSGIYRNATDEKKKSQLEEAKEEALDIMLTKYRYKAPKK